MNLCKVWDINSFLWISLRIVWWISTNEFLYSFFMLYVHMACALMCVRRGLKLWMVHVLVVSLTAKVCRQRRKLEVVFCWCWWSPSPTELSYWWLTGFGALQMSFMLWLKRQGSGDSIGTKRMNARGYRHGCKLSWPGALCMRFSIEGMHHSIASDRRRALVF